MQTKRGTWTYKRLSDTEGEVHDQNGQIGLFTYTPISAVADVFGDIFKWDKDLEPSKDMKCIGVTSSEIMKHK